VTLAMFIQVKKVKCCKGETVVGRGDEKNTLREREKGLWSLGGLKPLCDVHKGGCGLFLTFSSREEEGKEEGGYNCMLSLNAARLVMPLRRFLLRLSASSLTVLGRRNLGTIVVGSGASHLSHGMLARSATCDADSLR
jgi:hypothetical protein